MPPLISSANDVAETFQQTALRAMILWEVVREPVSLHGGICAGAALRKHRHPAYAGEGAFKFCANDPNAERQWRIDHMDVDVKGKRLFGAGLENGSLEVVDSRVRTGAKRSPGRR